MDASDIELNKTYTHQKKGSWRVRSYCMNPTVEMYNPETNETRDFGMGGIMAKDFEEIK